MNKIEVWCTGCKAYHTIDSDIPLNQQLGGHTWDGETKAGRSRVRLLTCEDELEMMADSEVCPECGVPHGPNPYTGCGE